MRSAATAVVALASVLTACGSSTTSPSPSAPRTTETLSTIVTLRPDGSTVYPNGFPTIVVRQRGQVDATATFTSTADCQFIFTVCSATIASACGTPALQLQSPQGPGPTLTASGTVGPDTYYLLMAARVGGAPLCSTVPPGGTPFSYSVSVTHP